MKEEYKMARDHVVSMTENGDLVGVYFESENGGQNILFETTPEKADKIIEIFNS